MQSVALKLHARFSRHAGNPNFLHADWLAFPNVTLYLVGTDQASLCRKVSSAMLVPTPKVPKLSIAMATGQFIVWLQIDCIT